MCWLCCCMMLLGQVAQEQPNKKDTFKLSKEEQGVLDRTNAERKKLGLAALKAVPALFEAARKHSTNMAARGVLAHELDGESPARRVEGQGYKFRALGENCAMGQRTAAEAVESWMQSPLHKANMLNAEYTDIGIGLAQDKQGQHYWTQVFARPAGK